MCEEESDDAEAVAKLLEINDSIHRTIERYKLVKQGDVEAASKIPKGTLGTATGVGKNAANELSLIDFEPELTSNAGQSQQTSVEDDLLGLSIGGSSNQAPGMGSIALGIGPGPSIPGASLLSSHKPPATNSSTMLVTASQPTAAGQPSKPNYEAFSLGPTTQPVSKPATPAPTVQHSKQAAPPPAFDPFASLIAPSPRAGSPANHRGFTTPVPSSSLLDFGGTPALALAPTSTSQATKSHDDDWDFTSALPEADDSQPTSHKVQVLSSHIKIEFLAKRQAADQAIHITAYFSNETVQSVSGLHFQVAVEKVYLNS